MSTELEATRGSALSDEIEKMLGEAGAPSPSLLAKQLGEAIAAHAENDREQVLSSAREAYREGFLLGRVTPRFVPFSAQMWRNSKIFQRLKPRDRPATKARSRYADYEDL